MKTKLPEENRSGVFAGKPDENPTKIRRVSSATIAPPSFVLVVRRSSKRCPGYSRLHPRSASVRPPQHTPLTGRGPRERESTKQLQARNERFPRPNPETSFPRDRPEAAKLTRLPRGARFRTRSPDTRPIPRHPSNSAPKAPVEFRRKVGSQSGGPESCGWEAGTQEAPQSCTCLQAIEGSFRSEDTLWLLGARHAPPRNGGRPPLCGGCF